jgi:hypothetical protein
MMILIIMAILVLTNYLQKLEKENVNNAGKDSILHPAENRLR